MNYEAMFGIDYGNSHGQDLVLPDYLEIKKSLTAKDDFKALILFAKKAVELSQNYLRNPKTNFTTVTLIELYNEYQNLINQKETLKKQGYDSIPGFKWDEKNRLFTRFSKLENLSRIKLMKKISKDSFLMN